jgi:hypothetical protein
LEEAMLENIISLLRPYAAAIVSDETGEDTERIMAQLLDDLDSDTADWLFDNWDSVLGRLDA